MPCNDRLLLQYHLNAYDNTITFNYKYLLIEKIKKITYAIDHYELKFAYC